MESVSQLLVSMGPALKEQDTCMKSETDSMYKTCTSSYQTDPWSEKRGEHSPQPPTQKAICG